MFGWLLWRGGDSTATLGVVCSSGGVLGRPDGVVVVLSSSQLPNFSNDDSFGRVALMFCRFGAILLNKPDTLDDCVDDVLFTGLLPKKL